MFFLLFARSDFLDLLLRSMSKPCRIFWLDEILTARGVELRRDLRALCGAIFLVALDLLSPVKWPAADVAPSGSPSRFSGFLHLVDGETSSSPPSCGLAGLIVGVSVRVGLSSRLLLLAVALIRVVHLRVVHLIRVVHLWVVHLALTPWLDVYRPLKPIWGRRDGSCWPRWPR